MGTTTAVHTPILTKSPVNAELPTNGLPRVRLNERPYTAPKHRQKDQKPFTAREQSDHDQDPVNGRETEVHHAIHHLELGCRPSTQQERAPRADPARLLIVTALVQ